MPSTDRWRYRGIPAVLATMHGKERVIAPLLHDELGLNVDTLSGLDTDRFGTFSRETARQGAALDAARAKIAAAFDLAPSIRIGLASEGSFGPDPRIPFFAVGHELVVLIDRERGLELAGSYAGPETNFAGVVANTLDAALAFAQRSGFPVHGLIVIGCEDGRPAPAAFLDKDVTETARLEAAVQTALRLCGAAFIETDMRAHRNPTRMAAIARATRDLVRRFNNRCPGCGWPGFDVTSRIAGLPCSGCGAPTRRVLAERLACLHCDRLEERPAAALAADPGECDVCNP